MLLIAPTRDDRSFSDQASPAEIHRPLTATEWQRLLDEFSHDLRTSLLVAGEYSRLLQDGCHGARDDERYESLEAVGDRLEEIQFLFDALLSIARLETERTTPATGTCPLHDVLDRVSRRLARHAAVLHVPFQHAALASAPTIRTDPRAVELILLALGRFALQRSRGSRPVTLRAVANRGTQRIELGVVYSGTPPEARHLAGLRDQLRVADPDDRGALNIDLGLACELSRRAGGQFTASRRATATELSLCLSTATD
ncbi:MAG: hypothetical protein WD069_09780 [Planctomycetales bacterium]